MNITELTIGIFAVTPEGAAKAYRDLTLRFYQKYGKYVGPHILMDTQPLIYHVQSFGDEERWTALVQGGVDVLIEGGADVIWMPANSSHLVMGNIEFKPAKAINMVDSSVDFLLASPGKPLALGTNLSMSEKLYFKKPEMLERCIRPNEGDRMKVHQIILQELVLGRISNESREFIRRLVKKHAEMLLNGSCVGRAWVARA